MEMGLLSLLLTILPVNLAVPVLPTPEALGRAYGLYGFDKDNLLKRLTKATKHLIVSQNETTGEIVQGVKSIARHQSLVIEVLLCN